MSTVQCRDYEYKKVSSGSRVGRLLVLDVSGRSKNGSKIWSCICDCGNLVEVISSTLNSGLKQSCGCLYDEVKGKQAITHGKSSSSTYSSWLAMRQRCYYKLHDYYEIYGGRGITVCNNWKNSFENFLKDMGEKPPGMSLDRIDTNGDYYKENCRWANASLQGFNTNKHSNNSSGRTGVSFHGVTNKWQASIGVNNETLYLGIFETYEEASDVRTKAELYYFGFIKE